MANNETHWQTLFWLPQKFDKLLKFLNQSSNLFSLYADVAFSKEIGDTCTQASNFAAYFKAQNNGQQVASHYDGPNTF